MKLLEFPHSHYCEKARWTLDYKGIPFEPVAIMPGFHVFTVRRYAANTAVPVLLHASHAVQGSSQIIDYLEDKYPECRLTPEDAAQRQACLEIEKATDNRLGVHLRKVLYYGLLGYPDFITFCFTHPMPKLKQFIVRLMYPVLRYKIYQTYVTSLESVERSKREFSLCMTELSEKLIDREYLVGNQFSRADLSVASMLSLLLMPAEHPFPWIELPDPQTRDFCDEYKDHPVATWAKKMYRDHRKRGQTSA